MRCIARAGWGWGWVVAAAWPFAFAFALGGCPRAPSEPTPEAPKAPEAIDGADGPRALLPRGGSANPPPTAAWARLLREPEGAWCAPGPRALDAMVGRALGRACTACHARTPPDALPRGVWPPVIEDMYRLAGLGDGAAIGVPPAVAAAWFASRAPAVLPLERGPLVDEAARARFSVRGLSPPGAPPTPAIAHVQLVDLIGDARLEIVACDMRHGLVLSSRPYVPDEPLKLLARLKHPCHAEVVDLDGDGWKDLLVCDLGRFEPGDHREGEVVWLRREPNGPFRKIVLASGLARPCDARAVDLTGDGRLDIVVASFGWRGVGEVLWLENQTTDWDEPRFVPHTIDARPGAVHVPPFDLAADGRPGFAAVLAQHHEEVLSYRIRADRTFERAVLYEAPHPAWGFNGLLPVDLDGDGRVDLVTTNGDTLDDHLLKPYHGVAWLRNQGGGRFERRVVAPLYGAHAVAAGDLDGDGRIDLVAASFLPQVEAPLVEALRLTSLVWLEPDGRGGFRRRVLEAARPYHMTIAVGDYDLDGKLDIVVGNAALDLRGAEAARVRLHDWVEVWHQR